jgi:hypothetical protein
MVACYAESAAGIGTPAVSEPIGATNPSPSAARAHGGLGDVSGASNYPRRRAATPGGIDRAIRRFIRHVQSVWRGLEVRRLLVAGAVVGALFAGFAAAQSITTQQDYMAADMAEMKALAKEANGDVYSLPHEKKIRVAEIMLKYFIRDTFVDPDSVHAIITNDPHHDDVRVWEGLLFGGHKTYSGMIVCARINGKNRLGGYVGDADYLVIFTPTGGYQWYRSPYFNEITQTTETNSTVTSMCPN